uniref:Uncharacterized protein n=1 Tax=Rhizophora mucronata TaxID=61149 RepID=A0A2P2P257_RHIMU
MGIKSSTPIKKWINPSSVLC